MKIFAWLFFVISMIFSQSGIALASELPSFTSCANPQGEIKASYDNGVHGIAGKSGNFEGKDVVYTISSNALTQCFCASDGAGIQTNWMKADNLSESEIKILTTQGWIYIPNGALWGLEDTSYLALNSDFSCKSSSGGGGGTSNNSGSTSSSDSSGNSGSGGSVSGASSTSGGVGQVLGLASTGNSAFVLGIFLIAITSLLTGLNLKKRAKNFSK